jgi:nicotinamide-nucleotide amidase
MNAEIISIGDEVLIGQIVNTNAAYLGQKMTALGIAVDWVTVVGDDLTRIPESFRIALQRAKIVIVTGGLGPTHDDVTKKAICDFFHTNLIFNAEAFENVRQLFTRMGRPVDDINREQALIPQNAKPLKNPVGTAPGLLIEHENAYLIILPGVPLEMKALFETAVQPIIRDLNKDNFIELLTLKTTGVFESKLFEMVKDIVFKIEPMITVAFLPTYSGVNMRLTASGNDKEQCQKNILNAKAEFESRLGHYIYAYDEEKIEQVVARLLIQQHQKIAVGDGFSGGLFSQLLTETGNSHQFLQGCLIFPDPEQPHFPIGSITPLNWETLTTISEKCIALARKIKHDFQVDIAITLLPDPTARPDMIKVCYGLVDANEEKSAFFESRKERTDSKARIVQFALDLLRKKLL